MTATPPPTMLIATFIAAGATLKIADQTGEDKRNKIAYLTATIAGFLLGSLTSYGSEESSIVTGIIIGVTLAKKINQPNLLLGLLMTVASSYILGYKTPLPWVLFLVTILSLLDELGHDRLGQRRSPLGLFFRYRGALKVALVFAAIASIIPATTAVGVLGFDFAYEAMNKLLLMKITTRN